MNIPDKAIDAVEALALQDAYEAEIDLDYEDMHGLRERIRKTLEAAAPILQAAALRDTADHAEQTRPPVWDLARDASGAVFATTVTVDSLRARADELDPS